MTEIDLRHVRVHRGTRANGFEELCCHLLSLEPPDPDARWVQKNGSGGDAGVEGYWALSDGSEVALQAKYFVDGVGDAQFKQIGESFAKMRAKHPRCTRYIVCLPVDLTDARLGPRAMSEREKWSKRVAVWQVADPTRPIEIELWGEFELRSRLVRTGPAYVGLRSYWLDDTVLSRSWLENRLDEAIATLGSRYTPELHVELDLSSRLDAIVHAGALRRRLADIEALPTAVSTTPSTRLAIEEIERQSDRFVELSREAAEAHLVVPRIDELNEIFEGLSAVFDACLETIDDTSDDAADQRDAVERDRRSAHTCIDEMRRHLRDCAAPWARESWACLEGEGGMGKSHLLADLCVRHLGEGAPAVLLPGEQLNSGDFWHQLLGRLGWTADADAFLGAMDTAGRAARSRAVLVVDALNERGRHDAQPGMGAWEGELPAILSRLARYPHVALVASCRRPYIDRVLRGVPETLRKLLHHPGFVGSEDVALSVLMDERGLERPTDPFLEPLLLNPLFLLLVTNALVARGETVFPPALRGVTAIFRFHFDALSQAVQDRLDLDQDARIPERAVEVLLEEMTATGTSSVARERALALLDGVHPSFGNARRSLLMALKEENLLSDDVVFEGAIEIDVVRFTYERYAEHHLATRFLDEHVPDLESARNAFAVGGPFRARTGKTPWAVSGFVESLSTLVPERLGAELFPLVGFETPSEESELWVDESLSEVLVDAFCRSLTSRTPDATNDATVTLFERLLASNADAAYDTLLRTAIEQGHRLGSDYLHAHLESFAMADRDAVWSAWLVRSWDDDHDGAVTAAGRLVHWAWYADTVRIDDDRRLAASVALAWMLTVPDRRLRDRATKAIVSLLDRRPTLVAALLNRFRDVDDPYVLERLHAVGYGVAMRGADQDADWDALVREVVDQDVACPRSYPNALLIDHARGTIRRIAELQGWAEEVGRVLPQFTWRETSPLLGVGEFDAGDFDTLMPAVYCSVTIGDFGTYVMNVLHDFEARRCGEPSRTEAELRDRLLNELVAERPEAADPAKRLRKASAALHRARTAKWNAVEHGVPPIDVLERGNADEDAAHAAVETARDELVGYMDVEQRENFRWLSGASSDRQATLSRKAAMRWLVQRVAELGWTKQRFEDYERYNARGTDRRPARLERMGKKYQWIAFHEQIAYLVATHPERDWGGGGTRPGDSRVVDRLRDLDPSCLLDGEVAAGSGDVDAADVSSNLGQTRRIDGGRRVLAGERRRPARRFERHGG